MQSEDTSRRHQGPRSRQARALTRAIDMVSEDFIEKFVQTGIDDGPERAAKVATPSVELHLRQVKEAKEARESREAKEIESQSEKQECTGFASLLAKASTPSTPSAFARLLENDEVAPPAEICFKPGTETTADGNVITVKETGTKKRGLYTSCMQKPSLPQESHSAEKPKLGIDQLPSEVGMRKPSAEQIEAAAAEAARINAVRAEARLQAKAEAEAQENSCCPLMKIFVSPVVALWQKLKSWVRAPKS